MPEIKCEYGHTQSIGTDAWVPAGTKQPLAVSAASRRTDSRKSEVARRSRRRAWLV